MVVTKDLIAFAFVGEEAQIDHIPFAEVTYVKEMTEAPSDDYDPEDRHFSHAMQIGTREDGYNSGRIYYISTDSQEALDDLIQLMDRLAKVARARAEARNWFRKLQMAVRKKYNSSAFQSLMAVLIAAASRPNPTARRPRGSGGPPARRGAAELCLHDHRVGALLPADRRQRQPHQPRPRPGPGRRAHARIMMYTRMMV